MSVTNACCTLCEKAMGREYLIGEGDVMVPIRMCKACFDSVDELDKLPRETVKLILDRLVERGIIVSHAFIA